MALTTKRSTNLHGMCSWNAQKIAKSLKLYGAGQDMLADAFSGNVKGMGPGVAGMEYTTLPGVEKELKKRREPIPGE